MKFGGIIRGWYKKNKRDLPMRCTRDPYKIWIAEVIMQQTRINQGIPYYLDFISAFPDVASLAAASEDEVLKKWQGLGYYNRARNLKEAARDIMERLGGEMPQSYEGLISLKGVGKYTAAAIASFCYGEPVAAVDGNVARVLARLFGVELPVNTPAGEKQILALASELMDPQDAGNHNQAMIDFGAMLCVPVSPDCEKCPLKNHCEAYGSRRVDQLPKKIPKKKPVDRWIWFYIIIYKGETMYKGETIYNGETIYKGEIILTQRGTETIWKSLYQFPAMESASPCSETEMLNRWTSLFAPASPPAFSLKKISPEIKHQLTHRTLHARFFHLEIEEWPRELPGGWMKISVDRLADFPVPQLIKRYMESINFSYI